MRKPKYILVVEYPKGHPNSSGYFDEDTLIKAIGFHTFFEENKVEAYEIEIGKRVYPEEEQDDR